jgi:quercetin dioxygenase-like cupin family protein
VAGFVLRPGEGPVYGFHGARVVIKASGEDTLGQVGVMESTYPPGLFVREHVHAGEDEMFYVLAGELSGSCGQQAWAAGPGSFVFVPRGQPHGFTVTSTGPVTALVITGPARLDRQIAERGESAPAF